MATYSFMDVNATFVGPPAFNFDMGYGAAIAEEGITVSMAEDKNTMLIGADGEGMHSLHAGKSGQITVRTLKTSPLNQKLSIAYNAQTNVPSLHGQNVIVIRNSESGDVITARDVAFKKMPDLTQAKEGGIQEWVFDAIKIDSLLGRF